MWRLAGSDEAEGEEEEEADPAAEEEEAPLPAAPPPVLAGGGGMLVLEEYEHAIARGATIYAELVGYGATSDGADMVAPSGEGAVRCMQMALEMAGNPEIDYLNTHLSDSNPTKHRLNQRVGV